MEISVTTTLDLASIKTFMEAAIQFRLVQIVTAVNALYLALGGTQPPIDISQLSGTLVLADDASGNPSYPLVPTSGPTQVPTSNRVTMPYNSSAMIAIAWPHGHSRYRRHMRKLQTITAPSTPLNTHACDSTLTQMYLEITYESTDPFARDAFETALAGITLPIDIPNALGTGVQAYTCAAATVTATGREVFDLQSPPSQPPPAPPPPPPYIPQWVWIVAAAAGGIAALACILCCVYCILVNRDGEEEEEEEEERKSLKRSTKQNRRPDDGRRARIQPLLRKDAP